MKNKIIFFVLAVLIILCIFVMLAYNLDKKTAALINDINELNSPKFNIGVVQGAASMFAADKYFAKSNIKIFATENEAYSSLKNRKIDALLDSELSAEYTVNKNTSLGIYPIGIENLDIVAAVKKDNYELIKKVNDFISSISFDGSYAKSMNYWLGSSRNKHLSVQISQKKHTGKLVVATNGKIEPYSYMDANGKLIGSDIELAIKFANSLNKDVEFVTMNFNELIPALQTGKVDVVFSNLYLTPERQLEATLSKPYLQTQIVAVVDKRRIKSIPKIGTIDDINNKKVGILTGSIFDRILLSQIPEAEPVYFSSRLEIFSALNSGKIDAAIIDEPLARNEKIQTNKIDIINPPLAKDEYGWIVSKQNIELQKEIDGVLAEFKKDGTLQKLDDIWFGSDETKKILPLKLGDVKKGTLKFGISAGCVPFTYVKDNQIVGFEIALVHLVGQKLGYGIELYNMDFEALIPAIMSEKMDLGGSMISITEERKKSVLFTTPIYKGGVVAIIKNTRVTNKNNLFIQKLKYFLQIS